MSNAKNLQAIIVIVSRTELWNKTVMAANFIWEGLFEGVGNNHVWGSARNELVTDIYKSLQVTTYKVLSMIDDPARLIKRQRLFLHM